MHWTTHTRRITRFPRILLFSATFAVETLRTSTAKGAKFAKNSNLKFQFSAKVLRDGSFQSIWLGSAALPRHADGGLSVLLSQLPDSPPHFLFSARHHFIVDQNCSSGSE